MTAWHVRTDAAEAVVFSQDGPTRLLGNDAYFHLRRAKRLAETFPEVERVDRDTGFPIGRWDDATGLFSLINLAVGRLTFGPEPLTTEQLARVSAWAPPVYAVLSHILVFLICWALRGPLAAAAGALLFLLYPGTSLYYSLLGFADHHALETALALLVMMGLLLAVSGDGDRNWNWLRIVVGAAPLVLFFVACRGAPVFLLVAGIAITALLGYRLLKGEDLRAASQRSALYLASFFVCYLMLYLLWPSIIIDASNQLAWWILGVSLSAVLLCGALPYAVELLEHRSTNHWKIVGLLTLLLSTLVLVFLQTEGGRMLLDELFLADTSAIMEQQDANMALYFRDLGGSGILAILGSLILIFSAFRSRISDREIVILVFALVLSFFWLRTNDFGYTPPPFVAVVAVAGLFSTLDLVTSRAQLKPRKSRSRKTKSSADDPGRRSRRAAPATIALAIGIAVVPLWPLGSAVAPFPSEGSVRDRLVYGPAWFDAAEWLQEHSPVSFVVDSAGTRFVDNAIMTAWDFGNIIGSHGDRAVVNSRYPRTPEQGDWFLMRDETEALARLCEGCDSVQGVSHVVVDDMTAGGGLYGKAEYGGLILRPSIAPGPLVIAGAERPRYTFGPAFEESLVARLYLKDGSGLSHLRLVFESTEESFVSDRQAASGPFDLRRITVSDINESQKEALRPATGAGAMRMDQGIIYNGTITPQIKVYEHVAGATVRGQATPGARLQLLLNLLDIRSDRAFEYRIAATAGANGAFAATVPYSTGTNPQSGSTIVPVGSYAVIQNGVDSGVAFQVSNEDMTEGKEVWIGTVGAPSTP